MYTEAEPPRSNSAKASDPASLNPIDRLAARLEARRSWWARFLGKIIRFAHGLYLKLEDKIDPMERVFKRMRSADSMELCYAEHLSEQEALQRMRSVLERQRLRHAIWILVDAFLSIGALALTPFLVPIPGPNFFLYYPALRMFSHYLAYSGVARGLRLRSVSLLPRSEIADIERLLEQGTAEGVSEDIGKLALQIGLEKLPGFIGRYL